MSHKKAHDKGSLPTNLRFSKPDTGEEPSYVPTIADRMLSGWETYGIAHASAIDNAQGNAHILPAIIPGDTARGTRRKYVWRGEDPGFLADDCDCDD